MDINRIRILLQKYYDGSTSLEEEHELSDIFSSGEHIPDEFSSACQQFNAIGTLRSANQAGDHFERMLENLIDSEEAAGRKISFRKRRHQWAIAAAVALLLGLSVMFALLKRYNKLNDTYSDPQMAYLEVERTLLYVSQKMNKGMEPLSTVSKINSATSHLKTLEKYDTSMEMLNLVSFINKSSNLKK
jgi:hypothetical protein